MTVSIIFLSQSANNCEVETANDSEENDVLDCEFIGSNVYDFEKVWKQNFILSDRPIVIHIIKTADSAGSVGPSI